MSKGSEGASFEVNLTGNAAESAGEVSAELEKLRNKINAGQNSIKQMSSALKALKGDSAEVAEAKKSLADQIAKEELAIAKGTTALLKNGTTSEGVAAKLKRSAYAKIESAKKEAEASKKSALEKAASDTVAKNRSSALNAAISKAGGPVAALRDKFDALKNVTGEGGAGGAMSLLTLGVAGAVAAVAALAVAAGALVVAFAKWAVKGADAARSTGLLREAAMGGNAQWGKNFGEQIDSLARNVPTARADIEKLGTALANNGIRGQTWVDTLGAVTRASAALGDEAGGKIKEFITRGREFGKFRLDPSEMIGSGVSFEEVAGSLATSMRVSVKDASQALFEGQVKLADRAAAFKGAVEKKFGSINLRQMLSLDTIAKKLGESFDDFTKGINLEPALKGLKELADMFSLNTVTGQALKQIVETFGNAIVGSFGTGTPIAKRFIYGLILGAQDLTIAFLKTRKSLRETFSGSDWVSKIGIGTMVLERLKITLGVVAVAAGLIGAAMLLISTPFIIMSKIGEKFRSLIWQVVDFAKSVDWSGIAKNLIDGLVGGLSGGLVRVKSAVSNLANEAKSSFKNALGIHSPSRVFAEYGEHTTEGYAQGVESSTDRAQGAVNAMVSTPAQGQVGARSGGGAITVNVTINASGGDAKAVAESVSSASILEQITQAVIAALQGGGVPVPS